MAGWNRRSILVLVLCLSLGTCLLRGQSAAAQEESGQVRSASIDTTLFPKLTTFLDVRDAEGNFVHGLVRDDISILEDENTLDAITLSSFRPGVQFALAVSPSESFTIQDSQAVSRYDYLVEALQAWATARQGSIIDDLSILATGGPELTHVTEVERWVASLGAYQSAGMEAIPGFDTLARALDMAADPSPRPGMGRAVLFITGLPSQDIGASLQNLVARASQRGVRLFIWLVASEDQFGLPAAVQLADLATHTGGSLFAFSGKEPIPDLDSYLEPLRNAYYLEFESRVNTSGVHQVMVQVDSASVQATSPVEEYEIDVQPPQVYLDSPPGEITRVASPAVSPTEEVQENPLFPQTETIKITVQFPDGHPRDLTRSTLFVDGSSEDSNTSPPFEIFTWDLEPYTSTGNHVLKAEIVDELGLSGTSDEKTVLVSIEQAPSQAMASISRNRGILVVMAVLLAGGVLALVLVLGGRLRPGSVREKRRKRKRKEPVSQPVPVGSEPGGMDQRRWLERLSWPQRRPAQKAYATLLPLSDSNEAERSPAIPISSLEIIFGSDPSRVTQILKDASVEGLHARLCRAENGVFRLSDEGSTAGTWVNFTPVSQEGTWLEHGDLIHFGRIGYRFMLREPGRGRKPVVKPGEPVS